MGTLSKLRRLVLREGVSVREAAQRLGIARNTASRWLALGDVTEPRYPKRVPAKSILEPFKEQLILWLKADMHRGKRDRRTTKEIFENIRELGYGGSRGPVYEYCKHWREQQKKAPRHSGFVPLSFELGEAFQFDWSCEYATVDVVSVLGTQQNVTQHVTKYPINQDGVRQRFQQRNKFQHDVELFDTTIGETIEELHEDGEDAISLDATTLAIGEFYLLFINLFCYIM